MYCERSKEIPTKHGLTVGLERKDGSTEEPTQISTTMYLSV